MSDHTHPLMPYLEAFDDHCRRQLGMANAAEGSGLLAVLQSAARQMGVPHMTDADLPVAESEPERAPEAVPYREA